MYLDKSCHLPKDLKDYFVIQFIKLSLSVIIVKSSRPFHSWFPWRLYLALLVLTMEFVHVHGNAYGHIGQFLESINQSINQSMI